MIKINTGSNSFERKTTYTGIDLLDKILEFVEMTPNEENWNYKSLENNPPRLIRLKQINSLLKSFSIVEIKNNPNEESNDFDLRIDINSIISGNFIKNNKVEEYNELIDFIKKFLFPDKYNFDRPIRISNLCFIYGRMIDYKIKLRNLIEFNLDWFESSSILTIFQITLTESISSNLIGKYDDLNEALELIINPKKVLFSEKELIEKFNFPTEDLHQIDLENY